MASAGLSVCPKYAEASQNDATYAYQHPPVLCLHSGLRWKIQNWNAVKASYTDNSIMYAEPFDSAKVGNFVKWQFGICPNANEKERMSLHIKAINCNLRVEATVTISVQSPLGFSVSLTCLSLEFGMTRTDWSDEVDATKIPSCIAPDGSLMFICDIRAVVTDTVIAMDQNYASQNYVGVPSNGFRDLFESAYRSDFLFQVGNDLIQSHKCILGSRSPVFAALFSNSEMAETLNGIIEITDCSADGVKAMLEFIYCGTVTRLEETVEELLMLSEKYELNSLKAFAENHLLKEIKTETVIYLLQLADLYNSNILKESIVRSHFVDWQEVFKSSDWNALKKTNQVLSLYVLENIVIKLMPPKTVGI